MAATKKTKSAVPAGLDAQGKQQALKTALTQIERDFGAGSIMKLGENTIHIETTRRDTREENPGT